MPNPNPIPDVVAPTPAPVVLDLGKPKKDSKYCVFTDRGHGRMHPVTGQYMTDPKNGKFFTHSKGVFHKGSTFFEGESNGIIEDKLISLLEADGIDYLRLAHPYLDTSLSARVAKANYHHRNIKKGFGMSIHSNASQNHNAKGFLVITQIGNTPTSDQMANQFWQFLKEELQTYNVNMRAFSPTSKTHKQNIQILRETAMPFFLSENGFFDFYDDAMLLMNPGVQDKIAKAHYRSAIWSMDNLKI